MYLYVFLWRYLRYNISFIKSNLIKQSASITYCIWAIEGLVTHLSFTIFFFFSVVLILNLPKVFRGGQIRQYKMKKSKYKFTTIMVTPLLKKSILGNVILCLFSTIWIWWFGDILTSKKHGADTCNIAK